MLAGFSGTQGRPAEFCQEKYGAVFLARDIGVKGEKGQTTERERGMDVCVRGGVFGQGRQKIPRGISQSKDLVGKRFTHKTHPPRSYG